MSAVPTCPGCGWTGKPTTPARAEYSLRQHSCDKQLRRLAARARGEARDASVDRTPRPCQHKRTSHQHGTHACYVLDRCRCTPCSRANAAYEQTRARQTAYGRWQPYVPADRAREHVRGLMTAGLGLKRVALLSGVPQGVLWKLVYGKRQADGSQRPSRRIRPENEAKLLAVRADLDVLGATVGVNATGTRRRLQALVARGWSQSKLAARLGMEPSNFGRTIRSDEVRAATARAVRSLYEELWDTAPPQANPRERIAAARARNYAAAHRWAPPLAWDDDTIDDPQARPAHDLRVEPGAGIDEAVVLRRIDGDTTVRLTRAERWEVVRRLHDEGLNDQQIARRTGLVDRQVLRDRQQLGLPTNHASAMTGQGAA